MNFLKQTKIEMRNVLRSKFVVIIAIIILAASIALPVIEHISRQNNDYYGPGPYGPVYETYDMVSSKYYEGGIDQETVTVDGVTITSENPYFWQIKSTLDEKEYMTQDRFTNPKAYDTVLELMDVQIAHYVRLASVITSHEDYRMDLGWQTEETLIEEFIYDHHELDPAVLLEAIQYRRGIDEETFNEKYVNITPEKRLAALTEVEDKLDLIYTTIENNDFPKFVELRIQQETDRITELEEQIKMHEQTIIDNPAQEEYLSSMIEDLQRQITLINTNNIPIWEYRLQKNIIPRDGSWQNSAIQEIENSHQQLTYKTILTEEKFTEERYLIQEYGTYEKYKRAMQSEIDELNKKILIAQHSLDADKPDMKFVPDGARSKTVGFLGYSVFVSIFAVLVGGWFIAREFSQGTIRLLMIRPKTRTKIIMSKFLSALVICLVIYTIGCLLNLITNGFINGFSDFANPNFTASGQVSFMAYYLPKFFACIVTILLGYTCAFMLSTVTKNIAVSIIVPVVCFIGSYIGVNALAYSRAINWLAYTPIPYVQISDFFMRYSAVTRLIERGIPISLTYGIILLLALSVVFTVISVWVFNRKDITK